MLGYLSRLLQTSSFQSSISRHTGGVQKSPGHLKVKIWFQNKRSKYKKIMKHGGGSEGEHLHSSSSISPCSPALPQLWEVSMATKGAPIHSNNYMNNFGHWYPNHHHHPHQDAVQRPQLM